jgi:hypothetical protein
MFALIYDTHELDKPRKMVVSVHKSRLTAEKALEKRKKRLRKSTLECDTRIVWVDQTIHYGDTIIEKEFSTWKPGEQIPYGEMHSDTD